MSYRVELYRIFLVPTYKKVGMRPPLLVGLTEVGALTSAQLRHDLHRQAGAERAGAEGLHMLVKIAGHHRQMRLAQPDDA